ncbi:MAG: hypothetical protein KDA85_09865, partial [Planctomycetaceae bacterium]|nr:hypothetical protein [Planctomycetaceae bacterium]
NALRTRVIEADDRYEIIRTRMATAEQLLADGKVTESQAVLSHFREVFYGTRELDHWLLWAAVRLKGDEAEMPVSAPVAAE